MRIFALWTVTYGFVGAPFLALWTLKQLVVDELHQYPLVSKALVSKTFVDDIITSTDTLKEN